MRWRVYSAGCRPLLRPAAPSRAGQGADVVTHAAAQAAGVLTGGRRQDLVHSHAGLLEGECAAGQVEVPDTGLLLVHQGHDVHPAAFQGGVPGADGVRVVLPQGPPTATARPPPSTTDHEPDTGADTGPGHPAASTQPAAGPAAASVTPATCTDPSTVAAIDDEPGSPHSRRCRRRPPRRTPPPDQPVVSCRAFTISAIMRAMCSSVAALFTPAPLRTPSPFSNSRRARRMCSVPT